jgi:hypothetical protein
VPAPKELKYMKILSLFFLVAFAGCTTIHYRSKNTIPVSFEGNSKHQKEVFIEGHRHFYFWGVEPEHHEVFIDEEVRKAGYDGISKLVIYEQKNPQDTLISFLTLGFYLPRGYTITGFASGNTIPDDLEDTAPPSNKK